MAKFGKRSLHTSAIKAETPKYLFNRNSWYTYIRNIPERHRHKFAGVRQVWKSLDTQDYDTAVIRAAARRRSDDAIIRGEISIDSFTYEMVIERSDELKITPKTALQLRLESIEKSIQSIGERFDIARFIDNPTALDVATIAGAIDLPAMTPVRAFERYEQINPELYADLNATDARNKRTRYMRSIRDFMRRVGNDDIDITKLTEDVCENYLLSVRTDIAEKKWSKTYGRLTIDHVRMIFRAVLKKDYKLPFTLLDDKGIKGKDESNVPPFTEADVRAILTAIPTSKLSEQAAALIQIGLITGAGIRELCWLTPEQIKVEAEIPHVLLRPNALRKKVKGGGVRHRDLPIVTADGIAIFRKYPNGFTDFQGETGPGDLNKEFNKFFSSVTPGKAYNSCRHRMDDLIKIASVDLGLKAAISGHTLAGRVQHYGRGTDGYTLKQKQDAYLKALEAAPLKEEVEKQSM